MISKSYRMIIASLCLVGFITNAWAISEPPAAGTPRDFKLPEKTSFQLDNGLRVTMVPFGTVPKISMALRVRTGNLNEGSDTWLADLTGSLMQEGTTSLDSGELARRAAELGGAIAISTGIETTTVGIGSLAEKDREAVALLADVVRNPSFPESELERIRRDLLRNLSISRLQPGGIAAVAYNRQMYGDHPFSVVFPTDEQLQSYTIEDVRRYYDDNFGAQRSHIFVSGSFDPDLMRRAITEHFSDWKKGPGNMIDVPTPTREGSLQVIDRPGSPQSTIQIGIPVIYVTNPLSTELGFMNDIFGGSGFLSRLFKNLREDKGYTYGPRTGIASHYEDSVWNFSADVSTPATGPSFTEFFKELRQIKAQPPSDDEMAAIRGYRGGTFVLRNASRGGIIGTLAMMDFYGLPDTYLTEYLARIDAVTKEQVTEIANSQLPVAGMTIVVVGDRSVIDAQLAEVEELKPYLED
jgi:predicted Zn-dependent peptidase